MTAICLTTMLLVIISTIGNGLILLQKDQAASSYGSNYGLFIAADGTQLKEVERRAEISDIGIMCTEGILKGNENGGFVSADETVRKMLPYNQEYVLKEGTYPEKAQEIAAGRAFFDAVGYHDVKVGDTVTLEYRSGMQSEYAPVEFTVSGILYDRDEYTIEASYVVFGSQDFYNERVAEGDRQYNIYFTLSDSANVSMNNVAPVIKEIADFCGIDQKNVIINDLYLQWVLQPSYEMIVVCGTLILGIVLFSVVVIYNIFQVGIAQKVQEYGKIKALGATRKQMKQLIFREGILLAVPSIPLGLLFGFLIAKVSFNWLVEQGNLVSSGIKNHQVPLFSLTIMLICIFVSFLTVVLALRKPMKIVSRISPIEATRYLGGSKTQKQGRRKGRKDVTVFSMAMANVTGNPKRTIATILTMGLSCVLFVIIANYVGNIDTEHEAGPIASIFYQGLCRYDQGIDMVEKSVVSYGSVQMGLLEKGMSWISLFIGLAPMLGFLGTVIGMIDAFDKIQAAGDIQPSLVAGGIKVALITTVGGLIVAMILQVFYNYCIAKIESIVNDMEDASVTLLDILVKYNQKH